MGNKEEKNNTVPNGSKETTGRRHKSARPGRISYVPINDEDLAPYEPPVRKKHKGLKITGIAVAMVIVSTGAAYAGMSYYYSENSLKEHRSMVLTVRVKLLMRQNRRLRRQ